MIGYLLLLPGFSTNEEVTEFSGRGVGMDVVKKNVESVGGTMTFDNLITACVENNLFSLCFKGLAYITKNRRKNYVSRYSKKHNT
mgnify:CR=1 FL=1